MISFHNVSKQYGSHKILNQINFQIHPNEMVLLSGPSGAGKSTVISLLIGAEKSNYGSVEVDGINVGDMSDKILQLYRRRIGVVYQDDKLLTNKTVFENVAFAMEVCADTNDKINQRVPEVLEKVGLLKFQDKFPHELSGGERQRVGIARALVHDPKLLIADEPTGNLDEENIKSIIELFKTLHKEGATVFLTTHNPIVQRQCHGRTLTLEKGIIK